MSGKIGVKPVQTMSPQKRSIAGDHKGPAKRISFNKIATVKKGQGLTIKRFLQITSLTLSIAFTSVSYPTISYADYQSGLNAYEKGDFAKALKEWRDAALNGDPKAQLGMGILHDTGRGVQANPTEAVRWYGMAAGQGVVTALYNLGRLYAEGRGVSKNIEEAERLWVRAAQGGSQTAQHNLGVLYYRGEGVKQDYDAAYEWFQRGAETGYAESQYMLGEMHRLGLGTQKDQKIAVRWLTLAELQGHQEAANRLRSMGLTNQGENKPNQETQTKAVPGQNSEETRKDPADTVAVAVSQKPTDVSQGQPGEHMIWLESFSSMDRATAHWRDLQKNLPDVFDKMEPQIKQVEVNGRTYYRLLTGPVDGRSRAETFCLELKRRSQKLNCRPLQM